jgi:hypothetical protein
VSLFHIFYCNKISFSISAEWSKQGVKLEARVSLFHIFYCDEISFSISAERSAEQSVLEARVSYFIAFTVMRYCFQFHLKGLPSKAC